MSADDIPAPEVQDRRWRRWAAAVVVTALAAGALLGFFVVPGFQRENAGLDLWTAICRAAGVAEGSPAYRQPLSRARAAPVSQVAWDPGVLDILANARPERGAQLAGQVCSACHGDRGVSATPEIPSLVGQSSAAIYKQLHDYRSGARVHPQMTPVATALQVPDLAAIAVFYGRNAQDVAGLGARDLPGEEAIVRLAHEGDPARRIPACQSCHAAGSGGPIETPVLVGQDRAYLAAQLRLYRSGARANDVYRRMRGIAAGLSDAEIDGLSRYYEGAL